MSTKPMRLSVIIPAKNESKHIKNTAQSVFDYLQSKGIEHEILVVTNSSADGTPEIVKGLEASIPTLKLLDYPHRAGKGFAVRTGMLKAAGDYRVFMDADNATKIDNIERFLPWFERGYDVVIASIAIEGAVVADDSEPAWRHLFGKMGNLYVQLMAVPGIWDTQRGFKAFSAKAAHEIFSRSFIEGWGFDVEVLALARKLGFKIKEIPIHWKNDPNTGSHPGLSAYFQVLRDTTKIRWYLLTGRYNRARNHATI